MPADFNDFVAEVKAAADLVTIIHRYVPLRKSGSRFVGRCPFHNDHSPSMHVTPQMGIYKCFVCGAGGDIFKFLMEHEKMTFIDALKQVAGECGIQVPTDFAGSGGERGGDSGTTILEANSLAAEFYLKNLQKTPEVLKYLEKRGISKEVQKQYQVGFAPGEWDGFMKYALGKGVAEKVLLEAGLIVLNEKGKKYDRFRNRLMFPIWNMSNRIVAFGGRTLEKGGKPKYLNSNESPLYQKRKILYGFNFARSSLKTPGEIIMVEGYMDVLALRQAGFANVAAVSGTALTDDHAVLISKFCSRAIMFLDGDTAGRTAIQRSLPFLLKQGIEVRVPDLPPEEDPDSYALKFGKEKTEALLKNGVNIVSFLTDGFLKHRQDFSPEEKDRLLRESLDIIGNIPSEYVKSEYIRQLHDILGISVEKYAPPAPAVNPSASRRPGQDSPYQIKSIPVRKQTPDWQLLQQILSSGDLCGLALSELNLDWLSDGMVRDLIGRILVFYQEEGGLYLPRLLEQMPENPRSIIESMEILDFIDFSNLKRQFYDIVNALEIRYIRSSMREINKKIRDRVLGRQEGIQALTDFQKRLKILNQGKFGTNRIENNG